MAGALDTDYLVLGTGAMGMAFTDALVDHADVTVTLVDRRPGPGGHWLDDYDFVRLHQASAFYGVASTLLGGGRVQTEGPEKGLHERASRTEVVEYYARVLARLVATGRVQLLGGWELQGSEVVSLQTGERQAVPSSCRFVDATLISPDIPVRTPPPFEVDEGAHVVPVNELPRLAPLPSRLVVVGSGKTATDSVVWLLTNGFPADAITWVRPRDPWMYNRAVIQPDPAVFTTMVADTMTEAARSSSPDDLLVRLEGLGVVLRIDPAVRPTMVKTPTLAVWELDLLRQVEHVVRMGHVRRVQRGRLHLDEGSVELPPDAVVLHCAASGLKYPAPDPVWSREAIRVQPIRSGFPCFGAALVGYVEATRDDDLEKNRVCRPTPFSDTPQDWCRMQVMGSRSAAAFGAEPDIAAWANGLALNPARVLPEQAEAPELQAARERLRECAPAGLAALAAFAG